MTSLQQERNQLILDIWQGKTPKRVPMQIMISLEYAIQYKGYSLFREYYSPKHCYEAAEELAKLVNSDSLPTNPMNMAAVHRYAMNKFMVPGKDGFYQHPNYSPMEFEEYPELIKDPLEFWVRKLRPRVLGVVEEDRLLGELRVNAIKSVVAAKYKDYSPAKLTEKYERIDVQAMAMMSMAPLDYIADFFRSFTNICIDIRRNPQWVLDACDAVLEFIVESLKRAPKIPGKINLVNLPLHMATYMKPKDYAKFYFPSFKKLIQLIQDHGYEAGFFCEENWDPHLDSLNDIPGRVRIGFEAANPKLIVEKLGNRHIICNIFDSHFLRTATPEEVKDEVKRLLDIVCVHGNYIFSFNKPFLCLGDAKMENIQAAVDAVLEYGEYK
ncbi:MAG: hypothetical protein GX893_01120 [Firmicutes bacterium]|nr:hypothetical protein [Bacillota bacterium]